MTNIKTIKYWLLTTEYPPTHGGGISTYCFFTAQMLFKNGYEVTVIVPDDKVKNFTKTLNKGIEVVRFNTRRTKIKASLSYTARLSYEFACIVKELTDLKGRPDVIEAQDYLGIAYYLLQFKYTLHKHLRDIPVLITLHSPAFLYLEYNRVDTYKFPDFWTCEMEKQVIASATHLISPSKFLPAAISKYINIDTYPLTTIPNPYYNKHNLIAKPGIVEGKIVYYGKLSPQKGSFELLQYFKELWDAGYQLPLYIVGGTDIVYHVELSTMGELVKKQYAKYIADGLLHLIGKVTPDKAYQYVYDANVIVFPSIVDNLPYVVLEMMSMGKVVLASKQGGQAECINDGINGFLFDHNIAGSFKEKLLSILKLSNIKINNIGQNAVETIRNTYALETILPLKHELIKRVISESKATLSRFPFLHQEPYEQVVTANNDDLLTVVIPYFNMGSFIRDAINSVKDSSYKKIEIIIIDDGSTDPKSTQVLNDLKNEETVTIISKKNGGLAEARNLGAKVAKGSFLAFLDADDRVGPDYYKKSIALLKQYDNIFFVGAWVQYFGDSNKVWPAFNPQPPYLLVHNPVNSSSLVYKREAFLKKGLNNNKLEYGLEDYDSVVSMVENGYNGVVLPEVHFYYRIRSGSMFRKLNNNKLIYSYKLIMEQHKRYYNKFAAQIINLLNSNGPGYYFDNPTEEVEVTSRVNKGLKTTLSSFIKKNPKLKALALTILRKIK